jgi:hypothetical protein
MEPGFSVRLVEVSVFDPLEVYLVFPAPTSLAGSVSLEPSPYCVNDFRILGIYFCEPVDSLLGPVS